ncbi:hypothetical protein TEQG_02023 [Trichophyton equinum CBS 127.97]|uniref:Uncharacterized protein n=1 Tax=Trichophyton equinum (strain ATCC MYA-4606 / CBS 127.97) TaxID=559882 RepID=F2PM88_TRIEC|nr:hypothetical protein TEQG_02023 [Trichophyton equinum CBS 127.97]
MAGRRIPNRQIFHKSAPTFRWMLKLPTLAPRQISLTTLHQALKSLEKCHFAVYTEDKHGRGGCSEAHQAITIWVPREGNKSLKYIHSTLSSYRCMLSLYKVEGREMIIQ